MKKLLMALMLLLLSMPAFANVIFTLGNHPEPHEYNVSLSGTGDFITGTFATNQKAYFVTPGEPMTVVGQRIVSQDGLITELNIYLGPHTFNGAVFNPFKPVKNNDLLIGVVTPLGASSFLYGRTNGNNFLTVTTTGESIDTIQIYSKSGFQGLEQTRIIDNAVPEPSSLVMLGSGLVGVGALLRRKLV